MPTKEQITESYKNICTVLGDIEVKLKSLQGQKDKLFKDLVELEKLAAQINAKETKNET